MFTHKWQINYYFCMQLIHMKMCRMFKSGRLWLLQTDICVFGWLFKNAVKLLISRCKMKMHFYLFRNQIHTLVFFTVENMWLILDLINSQKKKSINGRHLFVKRTTNPFQKYIKIFVKNYTKFCVKTTHEIMYSKKSKQNKPTCLKESDFHWNFCFCVT